MRRTSRQKKRKLTISALLIFSILILAVYQGSGLVRLLMLRGTVKVDTIKHDWVAEMVPVTGMLIKEEILLRSPLKGNLTLLTKEGQRISKGEAVAKVQAVSLDTPGGTAEKQIYTPEGGLFCTNVDGLEEVISPANLEVLSLKQLSTITKEKMQPNNKPPEQVDKGQVVAKLIDNLKPLLIYLEVPKGRLELERWQPENEVKFDYQGSLLSARVIRIEQMSDRHLLLLSVQQYPEKLVMMREVGLELINKELSGFLVPQKSLVYQENKPGLYIVSKQRVRWNPVEITGTLQQQVVVHGESLTAGLRYITNPQTVLEDDYIH